MSKELEAFSNLKGYLIAYGMGNSPSIEVVELYLKSQTSKLYFDKCAESDMWEKTSRELATDLDKLLTPPTEEEVCEALSTHFENIRYSQLFVSYVGREFEVSYEPFLSQVIAYKKDDGNVSIELELPPKLGKMIFAFYEGIESK